MSIGGRGWGWACAWLTKSGGHVHWSPWAGLGMCVVGQPGEGMSIGRAVRRACPLGATTDAPTPEPPVRAPAPVGRGAAGAAGLPWPQRQGGGQ